MFKCTIHVFAGFFKGAKMTCFVKVLLLSCFVLILSLFFLRNSHLLFANSVSTTEDIQRPLAYEANGQVYTGTASSGTKSRINASKKPVKSIPREIYMLWDVGWERAPMWQKTCLRSWQYFNPTHTVHNLNLESAEKLINRQLLIGNATWNLLKIQAKSDVIRVLLLAAYGGFWADASLACNKPLDKWVDYTQNFITFRRDDPNSKRGKGPQKMKISPWITSWFLAAQNTSYVIQILREAVLKFWLIPTFPYEYFWLHRLFASLVANNTRFAKLVNSSNLVSGNGPHCLSGNLNQQLMFKRCNKEYVSKKMENIYNNETNTSIV